MRRALTDTERLILEELTKVDVVRHKYFSEDPTSLYFEGSKDATDQILAMVSRIIKAYGGAS